MFLFIHITYLHISMYYSLIFNYLSFVMYYIYIEIRLQALQLYHQLSRIENKIGKISKMLKNFPLFFLVVWFEKINDKQQQHADWKMFMHLFCTWLSSSEVGLVLLTADAGQHTTVCLKTVQRDAVRLIWNTTKDRVLVYQIYLTTNNRT